MRGVRTDLLELRRPQPAARREPSRTCTCPDVSCGVSAEVPTAAYPALPRASPRLGEWLVARGLLERAELFTALDASFRHGCRLGDALVWLELLERGTVESEARRLAQVRAR